MRTGSSAEAKISEKGAGSVGELHPGIANERALEKKVCLFELGYALLERKFAKDIVYRNLPKFADVQRDLAIVVKEEVTCGEVQACILRACKSVKKAELFDVYRSEKLGADKKSMAFRLTFAHEEQAEKPFEPETLDKLFRKIVGALEHTLGAELR